MVMANNEGGESSKLPRSKKPWYERKQRPGFDGPRFRKASISLTQQEDRAIRERARRARMTVSQFLRAHFPPELFEPLPENN